MILVMGGTSEARELVEHLDNSQVVYTTATGNTAHISRFQRLPEIHLVGPLDCAQLVRTIKEHGIGTLLDATHPFAVNASENAIAACRECDIAYIRLERPRVKIPASGLIRIASGFDEAVDMVREMENARRILLSIGVNHLGYFQELVIQSTTREVYCQVLDIPQSLKMARKYGIELDRVLTSQAVPTLEYIHRILQEFQLDLIVFKESGYRGGTDVKIEAGVMTGTPMILIDRPKISYPIAFEQIEDMISSL